jgi:hypothetical protein
MEAMANDVLNTEELEFMAVNADEIKRMASEQWSGTMPMDKRAIYQTIFLKLGGRQEICYTCGGSLKQLGKRLEQWL